MQSLFSIRNKMLGLTFTASVIIPLTPICAQGNFFTESVKFGDISIPVMANDPGAIDQLAEKVDLDLKQFAATHFVISSLNTTELNGNLKKIDLDVMRVIKNYTAYKNPVKYEPNHEMILPANANPNVYQSYSSLELQIKNTDALEYAKKIRDHVCSEAMAVSGKLKIMYQRFRPLSSPGSHDFAFPSQHATFGRIIALYYYHFLGKQKEHEVLIDDGIRIGVNRVLAWRHHPTDILAGEYVSNQVFCHKFKNQFYGGSFKSCTAGISTLPSILGYIKNGGKGSSRTLRNHGPAFKAMKKVLR